jgi:hypothetical protein
MEYNIVIKKFLLQEKEKKYDEHWETTIREIWFNV